MMLTIKITLSKIKKKEENEDENNKLESSRE